MTTTAAPDAAESGPLLEVPVAPGRVPGLGHLPSLARDPLRFMESLLDTSEVVLMHIGRRPVYVVNSLRLVHDVLVAQVDDFRRGIIFAKAEGVLGKGLTVAEGETHRKHRQMLQPVLQRREVRRHVEEMCDVVEARLAGWRPGVAFDVNEEMQQLGMEIFGRALFSEQLASDAARRVQQATPAFMTGIVAMSFYPHPLLERVPIRVNREFALARVNMVASVDEILDRFESSEDQSDLAFLAGIIAAKERRTGEQMDREQLRDEVVNLVVAGATAPGTTLAWLFHELSQHPDVEEELIEELAALGDGPLSPEHLEQIPLTAAVVRETLRLHTPTWFLSRHSTRETRLGDYRIPADSELAFSLTMLHRHDAAFADPGAFRPRRWLDGSLDDMPRDVYLPFGAGKHGCLGEHFTQQVMMLSVAGILRRWRLVRTDARPVREVPMALVQAKGLTMAPHPLASPALRADAGIA